MILAVWGLHGSGKTTIACEIASALALEGKEVLLLSGEEEEELPLYFQQVPSPHTGIPFAKQDPANLSRYAHRVRPHLHTLGSGRDCSGPSLLTGEEAEQILTFASRSYSHVIVDCPSGKLHALTGKALKLADLMYLVLPTRLDTPFWAENNAILLEKEKSYLLLNHLISDFDTPALLSHLNCSIDCELPCLEEKAWMMDRVFPRRDRMKQKQQYASALWALLEESGALEERKESFHDQSNQQPLSPLHSL